MSIFNFILIVASQVFSVTGQIFMKKSATRPRDEAMGKRLMLRGAGIAAMTLGFFLWLGLMSKFELSYLFPFEGIHYILIVIAAAIFLKERATPALWIGVTLISAGVAMVSAN